MILVKHLCRLRLFRVKRGNHFPMGNYNLVYFFGCFQMPSSAWILYGWQRTEATALPLVFPVGERDEALRYGVGCAGGGRGSQSAGLLLGYVSKQPGVHACRMALEPVGSEKGTLYRGGQDRK